jgi:hypothetical protein
MTTLNNLSTPAALFDLPNSRTVRFWRAPW